MFAMRWSAAQRAAKKSRSVIQTKTKMFPFAVSRRATSGGRRFVSYAGIAAVLSMVIWAQAMRGQAGIDVGSVTGTVKDPGGALVPGASLTLTNRDTGVAQSTISTHAGAYDFPSVRVGTYSLTVQAQGFKEIQLQNITVHLATTATEDITLRVGSASAEITVTSEVPLLQAQDASLGTTFDSEMVNDLPIFGGSQGRSFMELTTLAAGVQFTGSNDSTSTFLVHGVQSGQVDVRLNGMDDNAEVFGGISIPPIPDAIQEFKLEDGNNSAELGEFYGPVVSVVTMTGTNRFSGSVWEYFENDKINANDYFNKLHQLVTGNPILPNRPGRFKENSYGGIIGGPVILPHYNGHNRTFFTFDYQRTNYTSTPTFTGTVPTANMTSSNFTNLSDTLTLSTQTNPANVATSEKQDAIGRYFQIGMMMDPATTRAVVCGAADPITGMMVNCKQGYVPTINGIKYGILRDPFLSSASTNCPTPPTLQGTTAFNSTYNLGAFAPGCFNQLPANRVDPNAVALLKLFPAPNQPTHNYGNNYFATLPSPVVTQQYDVRIDHTISRSDMVFGTYSYRNAVTAPAPPFPGVLEGGSNVSFWTTNPTYMVVLTWNHVFNPRLLNEFRAGDEHNVNTRTDPGDINNTTGIPAQFGIGGIPQAIGNGGLPTFSINSGISSFGSRTNITFQKVGAWTYSDNVTWSTGRHDWKFGAQYNATYGDIAQPPYSRGSFTYNGQYSNTPNSGDADTGMADFLLLPDTNVASGAYAGTSGMTPESTTGHELGGASAYQGNNSTKSTYNAPYVAFFAVDTVKLTPRFTANIGLREEYFAPYSSKGGTEANFWMGGAGNDAAGSAYYIAHDGCNTPRSPSFNGLLAYDNIPIICRGNNTANNMPKALWAPRVGFAYRLLTNLVVRAGAGIAYGAFGSVGFGGTLGTNYPFRFNVQSPAGTNAYTPQLLGSANNVTATMENTFSNIDMTNPLSAYLPLGSLALYGKQYNFNVPHVKTMTAAVQWQFSGHDSVEARYVGNIGQNLESANPYHNSVSELLTQNTSVVTSCATQSNPYCETGYVPFPNLSPNAGPMETTGQVSNYQSAESEYRHVTRGGFTMDANYTFARCWSDAQGGQQNSAGPGNGRAPWVIGFGGYRADYDRCTNLAANVFKAFGDVTLPVGRNARFLSHVNAWEDAVIGGWKLSPIFMASSGTLNNVLCQGSNGYGPNPTYTGPWFQTSNTALSCNAPTVAGVSLYGPGPKDHARTKFTGLWNSSAFTAPASPVETNGQMDFSPLGVRGNQLYGPGFWDFDLAIHKQFRFTEHTRLELQVQAVNAFNHAQMSNPPNTSGYTNPSGETLTGGWGTVTTTRMNNGEGRILQLVGKLHF